VIVGTAFWLAKQFASDYELSPINSQIENRLSDTATTLERAKGRRGGMTLSTLLDRIGRRDRAALILVEPKSKNFIYGFPHEVRPDRKPFMQLRNSSVPFTIKMSMGTFHGPVAVLLDDQQYKLFIGKTLPPGVFKRFQKNNPGILISAALLLSGMLCAWMAWSLVRPLRQLQRAVQLMSAGDLDAKVQGASERTDEIGQLSQDFNRMSHQVATLLAGQKRLLADISHELRSPLARLQVAIGIAYHHSPEDESAPIFKQLSRIEKEAHQIEAMLQQTLILSRLESLQNPYEKQEFAVAPLLTELINDTQFEAQAENKKVEFSGETQAVILGDMQIFASACSNVLRNAIKYCSTKVEVCILSEGATITIQVSDDGSGVSEQELNDIFTPFYRLSASRNRNTGGVGLGLAIAQQAVFFHRGEIAACNNAQGGLTVTLTFPVIS
jgi:two-component system sensor histidine kinase CpxA